MGPDLNHGSQGRRFCSPRSSIGCNRSGEVKRGRKRRLGHQEFHPRDLVMVGLDVVHP